MYGLIFAVILVAIIVLFVLVLLCFISFLVGFIEKREDSGYVNMNESLFMAWSYDKGYSFGEFWTRVVRGGRRKVDHGKKYTTRRYNNE